ncbi:hypothetical protein N8J89_28720 [Crossiella sp. CA-258035]|uniref:hypothetical protein n=1 Tax=Crossiella sp. CA-258035 TaxID=2981138 RepID=UPI0024BC7121|nr:hypothetical protein [Crossiella sp. CA-258035]WHT17094.1 hypothetical protein N8J89_28720 [Crossiella sp. CA-258035]
MTGLDALVVTPKTGAEPITGAGAPPGADLRGFWSWSCSDLVGNAMRGVLAEYLVGLALDCVTGGTRIEWDAADLRTAQGWRIEVKSAAYLQSWRQERLSDISFDIRPTAGWDHATNTSSARARQSDAYVFCLFRHQDKATANPLDVDQWVFHVLATRRLTAAVGEQKRIGLASLLRLDPRVAAFPELPEAVAAELTEQQPG